MAASLKSKRTPITTPPYQVLSVDITLDPPIFSLVTTYKQFEQRSVNAAMPAPLTFESTLLPDSADGLCSLQMEMFTEICRKAI